MILDSTKNAERYYALLPRLRRVFDYIATTDLAQLEVGRHDIDGDNLFVNVMDVDLKPRHEAALEVHDRYLDIQIMVGADEEYGWSERCDCHSPREEFNRERDVQFFTDAPQTFFTLNERQFAIFFPKDAHAPMLGEGKVRKLIFKLLIN